MPRLRTITAVTLIVVACTDVTWDDASLHVSFGVPRGRRLVSFRFP
jgi:hypothetical protein